MSRERRCGRFPLLSQNEGQKRGVKEERSKLKRTSKELVLGLSLREGEHVDE